MNDIILRRNAPALIAIAAIQLAVAGTQPAPADGFRNPPPGGDTAGRIGGNIVHTEGPSSLALNPANISAITTTSVQASALIAYGVKKFKSDLSGVTEESNRPWSVLPGLFAVWPVNQDSLTAGIGLHVPYGRNSQYDSDAGFRFSSPYASSLYTVDIQSSLALKVNDRLTIAAGADLYYSEFEIKQHYPWAAATGIPGLPTGLAKFESDGFAVGGHAAANIALTERQSVSIVYRSQFDIDYEGDFSINYVPDAVRPAGVTSSSDFESTIKYPNIWSVGYGVELNDSWSWGLDFEWLEHSRNDRIPIDIENNNQLLAARSVPQDWDDSWTIGTGAEYSISEELVLRLGYMYLESPVPDSTLIPVAAEVDQHIVSVGLGFAGDDYRLDVGYSLGIFDSRHVRNSSDPSLNGTYDFESHFLGVAYAREL